MGAANEIRVCPFCREEIKAEAIKCKHCGSSLAAERPGHNGTCLHLQGADSRRSHQVQALRVQPDGRQLFEVGM